MVVMWLVVGVVGRAVVVVFLLLVPGARHRLQEHLLRRDGTEGHEASSAAGAATQASQRLFRDQSLTEENKVRK